MRSPPDTETDFRQLRHQTKNALQRILCQVAQCRDLQATVQGQRLLADVERRIQLSVTVSDALFGFVQSPRPLPLRLERLCQATLDLLGDPDQLLRLQVAVDGPCAPALASGLLRISHELVGNAVKHGMYARSVGAIAVRVSRAGPGATRLEVADDGWGFQGRPVPGQRLALIDALLRPYGGGTLSLERRGGQTVAAVTLRG